MKKIFLMLFVIFSLVLTAHSEESSFIAEDFANQSLYWAQNNRDSNRCQAIRILPKWYLTAAHCVVPVCNKECSLTFQLIQGPLQASARIMHTASNPKVFVPREYVSKTTKSVRHDMALIRFDEKETDFVFYDAKKEDYIEYDEFLETLNQSQYRDERNQWHELSHARPKLMTLTEQSRHVVEPISVPDLRQDGIFFSESRHPDFYYFSELRHFMGTNFGISKGMSGGGVVTPGGGVIGIVSARLGSESKITLYDENDKPTGTIPYSSDYFLFTPFSHSNVNFIRATIASFHESGANPYFVRVSEKVAEMTNKTPLQVFGGMSAEEISDVKMSR